MRTVAERRACSPVKRMMRIVGLMSGTSADGIDACLAEIGEERGVLGARVRAFVTVPYPSPVRRRVLSVRTVEDVCRLNFELGELFARAALKVIRRAGLEPGDVHAIGSHGQTVYHVSEGPMRSTLQIGEPSVIAERTGITTVADFRPRDIAAGGCGAPLVPIVDFLLLGHPRIRRVALNIGGIANVTLLRASGTVDDVVAFDTGPGNMVVDGLMERLTDGREACDRGGRTAARGRVCEALLARLLADQYYAHPPPKSTGREKFGVAFVGRLLRAGRARRLPDADLVATATALTARTIADAVERSGFAEGTEVIVSGGGVRNVTLMAMLRRALPGARVAPSDAFGISADGKEALAFAVLAWLTLHGRPGNVRGATGAARRAVLGRIVPGGAESPRMDADRDRKTRQR